MTPSESARRLVILLLRSYTKLKQNILKANYILRTDNYPYSDICTQCIRKSFIFFGFAFFYCCKRKGFAIHISYSLSLKRNKNKILIHCRVHVSWLLLSILTEKDDERKRQQQRHQRSKSNLKQRKGRKKLLQKKKFLFYSKYIYIHIRV